MRLSALYVLAMLQKPSPIMKQPVSPQRWIRHSLLHDGLTSCGMDKRTMSFTHNDWANGWYKYPER